MYNTKIRNWIVSLLGLATKEELAGYVPIKFLNASYKVRDKNIQDKIVVSLDDFYYKHISFKPTKEDLVSYGFRDNPIESVWQLKKAHGIIRYNVEQNRFYEAKLGEYNKEYEAYKILGWIPINVPSFEELVFLHNLSKVSD